LIKLEGLGISHSVAVAEVNDQLQEFLSSKKHRKPPNLYLQLLHDAVEGKKLFPPDIENSLNLSPQELR